MLMNDELAMRTAVEFLDRATNPGSIININHKTPYGVIPIIVGDGVESLAHVTVRVFDSNEKMEPMTDAEIELNKKQIEYCVGKDFPDIETRIDVIDIITVDSKHSILRHTKGIG